MKKDDFSENEYQIKELLLNELFQSDVKTLRLKYGIPTDGFKNNRDRNRWNQSLTEKQKKSFDDDIEDLLYSYSKGYKWIIGAKLFIETGNVGMLRVQNRWGLEYTHTGESRSPQKLRSVKIAIDPSTTEKDVKDALKQAKKAFSEAGMVRKPQQITNLDRDFEIYQLSKSSSVRQIVEILNDRYTDELFDEDKVKKIIFRAKHRFSMRHPWSE